MRPSGRCHGGCAGHRNVHYIGDRVKQPGQINGKSTNLNHVLLNHIYPWVQRPEDVPEKDLLLVMDCDHMVHHPPFPPSYSGPTLPC